MVLHYDTENTINLTTRMWALDELRALTQHEPGDTSRTQLDIVLSRLNHGDMPVISRLTDLIILLKCAIETNVPQVC